MLAVKVLAFDTGGTILDWHSGLVAALKDCGARRGVDGSGARRESPENRRQVGRHRRSGCRMTSVALFLRHFIRSKIP